MFWSLHWKGRETINNGINNSRCLWAEWVGPSHLGWQQRDVWPLGNQGAGPCLLAMLASQGGGAGSPPSPPSSSGTELSCSGCKQTERCSPLLGLPEQLVVAFALVLEGEGGLPASPPQASSTPASSLFPSSLRRPRGCLASYLDGRSHRQLSGQAGMCPGSQLGSALSGPFIPQWAPPQLKLALINNIYNILKNLTGPKGVRYQTGLPKCVGTWTFSRKLRKYLTSSSCIFLEPF